ncbi:MAG: 5-formyltetrahydrofolate cyclo-ligase, partial [Ancalomicrobiaceae bacterium]|nr:5-formyltetrahydrofolate cyclo-ligase [Ancalomicrobiaceae bacterium]
MPEIFPFTQLPTPNAGAPDRSAEPLKAAKAALRRAALARRDGLDPAERIAAARTIAADVGALPFSPGCAIGGYLAIRSEIDPAPLLEALRAAGHALALPVIRAD